MIYTIAKRFEFSASHQLDGLPEGHQCARLHGHNYIVEVTLASETLTYPGFVMDYGDLAPLKQWLDSLLDHRHLNDIVDFNPTAEALAEFILEWCEEQDWPVTKVGVSETPKTWAWVER